MLAGHALVFDFDDTLVRTEPLKALSYARAAVELAPGSTTEAEVLEAFKDLVGRAREEVARAILDRFHLPGTAEQFLALRLTIYDAMLDDATLLLGRRVRPTIEVARAARTLVEKVACGSMSQGAQVRHVLGIIGLSSAFDLVVGREEVVHGKPDPEIYTLIAARLGLPPSRCLAIEDSAAGLRAARAAGMTCLAVPTELSRAAVTAPGFIDPAMIVEDPRDLRAAVERVLAA